MLRRRFLSTEARRGADNETGSSPGSLAPWHSCCFPWGGLQTLPGSDPTSSWNASSTPFIFIPSTPPRPLLHLRSTQFINSSISRRQCLVARARVSVARAAARRMPAPRLRSRTAQRLVYRSVFLHVIRMSASLLRDASARRRCFESREPHRASEPDRVLPGDGLSRPAPRRRRLLLRAPPSRGDRHHEEETG